MNIRPVQPGFINCTRYLIYCNTLASSLILVCSGLLVCWYFLPVPFLATHAIENLRSTVFSGEIVYSLYLLSIGTLFCFSLLGAMVSRSKTQRQSGSMLCIATVIIGATLFGLSPHNQELAASLFSLSSSRDPASSIPLVKHHHYYFRLFMLHALVVICLVPTMTIRIVKKRTPDDCCDPAPFTTPFIVLMYITSALLGVYLFPLPAPFMSHASPSDAAITVITHIGMWALALLLYTLAAAMLLSRILTRRAS